jgi:diguanylate cyclase (GGDEF)-like protein
LLLQQIGPRLRSVLRESDTVARLGGDEFAVLLPSTDGSSAMRVAAKLARAVEQPFVLSDHRFHIGTSVGVALFPRHSDDVAALLREADVAMYVAKRSDQDCMLYRYFVD